MKYFVISNKLSIFAKSNEKINNKKNIYMPENKERHKIIPY